jgi:hypothetical protein
MVAMKLIGEVRAAAKKLRLASLWRGTWEEVDVKNDYFVYEHLCFLKAVLAAVSAYEINVVPRHHKKLGKPIVSWPRGPGRKDRYSYFDLARKSKPHDGFQLCPGIKVKDLHGIERAPDINLLRKGATDSPTHADLHAMWDAKHVDSDFKRLAGKDVFDFIVNFEELGCPATPSSWSAAVTTQAFTSSGLLTNGRPSTEPDSLLMKRKIFETATFPRKPVTRP